MPGATLLCSTLCLSILQLQGLDSKGPRIGDFKDITGDLVDRAVEKEHLVAAGGEALGDLVLVNTYVVLLQA